MSGGYFASCFVFSQVNFDLARCLRIRKAKYKGNREQGTGNRNGGCRVDYEIVHALPAAPFSNKYHCGASIAATGFSRIPLFIYRGKVTFVLVVSLRARLFLFPVPCSLFPVPFDLPLEIPPTSRQIRICIRQLPYFLPFTSSRSAPRTQCVRGA